MNIREKIAALILSGGFSSRMPDFKPLLPVGETSAVRRVIELFQKCGLSEILVVTGHRAADLSGELSQTRARAVFNSRYTEGMFSSVTAGVGALDADCKAFFILPVDVPLVRPSTIQALLAAWTKAGQGIFYPCFCSRRGHPPLIDAALIADILQWQGADGLCGCLGQWQDLATDVAVVDETILLDMDTADSYAQVLNRWHRYEIPTPEECRTLMQDVCPVSQDVWDHCQAVARVAERIGAALNRAGFGLDLKLLKAAGLTHDVARRQKDHAAAGARLLSDLGFGKVADVVAVHMDIEVGPGDPIDEHQVLHLADKMIAGAQQIDPIQRFERKMKKYGHKPEALAAIVRRREKAMRIKTRIEEVLGQPLEKILDSQRSNPNDEP